MKISKSEGVGSLWSGLSPTLVLAVPATIAYFVVYEQLRLKLKDIYNKRSGPIPPIEKQQPFWIPLISGATARVISVSIVSPLELIRTKMQSQRLSYFGKYFKYYFTYNETCIVFLITIKCCVLTTYKIVIKY